MIGHPARLIPLVFVAVPNLAGHRDPTVETTTVTVWQPITPLMDVGPPSLPEIDLQHCSPEVQVAWRMREKDGMATAAAVLEREHERLDAGGWLALAEVRRQRAQAAYAAGFEAGLCADCPAIRPLDASPALSAYARVQQLDARGVLTPIARYYAAELLGDWNNQVAVADPRNAAQARATALAMLGDVAASGASTPIRIAALLRLGLSAFDAGQWPETADLLARAMELAAGHPGAWGPLDEVAYRHAVALYRAGRNANVIAVVARTAPSFGPGPDRARFLDLAAAALEALGRDAPPDAWSRFGPYLDGIRRKEGAADANAEKVAGAIVHRCVRASAAVCVNTQSIFSGVPPYCDVLLVEGQASSTGIIRTRVLDRGRGAHANQRFHDCLNGWHPAVYGSGLRHPVRFRFRIVMRS